MKKPIEARTISAAENILYRQNYVSAIDVLMAIGWLKQVHVEDWRRGRVAYLEQVIEANLSKISCAMKCFHRWAVNKGLKPSVTVYMKWGKGAKKKLRFSISGNSKIEISYSTHYLSPLLSDKKTQRIEQKLEQAPELLVFIISKTAECSKCKKEMHRSNLLYKEGEQALCMKCAGFDDFYFLESGNSKLTIRAKKYSKIYAVVLKFSKTRKRYERQGLLIPKEALELAQASMDLPTE
jgi:hypothetical protein